MRDGPDDLKKLLSLCFETLVILIASVFLVEMTDLFPFFKGHRDLAYLGCGFIVALLWGIYIFRLVKKK